jgi:hypothetical protein
MVINCQHNEDLDRSVYDKLQSANQGSSYDEYGIKKKFDYSNWVDNTVDKNNSFGEIGSPDKLAASSKQSQADNYQSTLWTYFLNQEESPSPTIKRKPQKSLQKSQTGA